MRPRTALASAILALAAAASLDAQTVRGVVIDDSTKLPIDGVLINALDAAGQDLGLSARSDTLGRFVIHFRDPGRYRVRAVRIGYQPVTSDPISLGVSQLAEVRLQMSTVAERLVPVRVVERRRLSPRELMSATGFDLRRSKGLGNFLGVEQLEAYGVESVFDVLNTRLRHLVYVADTIEGTVLLMRRPGLPCNPEIYLDGNTLTGGNLSDAVTGRNAAALAQVGAHPANSLHGIEVYRGAQIPPTSLGGYLGGERTGVLGSERCGVVAVWTKEGARRAVHAARRAAGPTGVQVLRGTVVDFDTGKPVPDVPITLLSELRDTLDRPVVSDSQGGFVIRTKRSGRFRLGAGSIGFNPSTTAPFEVTPEELIILQFFVSAKRPVMVPLGIAVRALPETYAVNTVQSYLYRREHGVLGTFFGPEEIEDRGVKSIGELVRGVEGVFVTGTAPADTVAMVSAMPGPEARCFPAWFVEGVRVRNAVDSTIRALPLADVVGVEVYRGPSEIPVMFADVTDGDCGMIGIWTMPR